MLANGIAQMLNTRLPEFFKASAQATAGTAANIRLMDRGDVEFAFGQAGIAFEAFNGVGNYTPATATKTFSGVTYLYPNVFQIVVPKDLKVKSFTDLRGRRVAVGASGSATELNARDLARVHDMDYMVKREFVPEFTSEASSVELIQNRQVDAVNLIGALGSASMRTLMATGRYEILPFSDEVVLALNKLNPAYYRFVIPANFYPNQPEPVAVAAVANWLYVANRVPEDIVYLVTKAIYENQPMLQAVHVAAADIKRENALRGMAVPLHPGAARYFREIGVLR